MSKHRWLLAWGLGSIAAGAASLLVPLYVVQLGGDPFELGLLGAVAAFVGAPGAIVWGRLADRTANPRAVILFSLLGVGLLLGIVPLLSSIPVLIALNATLWLVFAAAGPVLTLLVVADVPEPEWSQQIALLNKYQGYGWAAGLLLGVAWSIVFSQFFSVQRTQQSLFVVCGLVAVLAAGLLARWMPAPTSRQLGLVDPRRVGKLLSTGRQGVRSATFVFNPNRLYWTTRSIHPRELATRFTPTLATYYLAVVIFFTGFAAFFAPLPLFLTASGGFSSDAVFGLYLLSSLGSAAFYTGAGRLSSRYDMRLLQAGALGTRAVAMPLVALAGVTLGVTLGGIAVSSLLFGIIGITWAVIAVTAGTVVTRLAPQDLRGEALGVYAALSALAGGIGSIGGGALAAQFDFTVAFGVAGAITMVGAALVVVLRTISEKTRFVYETPPSLEADD